MCFLGLQRLDFVKNLQEVRGFKALWERIYQKAFLKYYVQTVLRRLDERTF